LNFDDDHRIVLSTRIACLLNVGISTSVRQDA
jgi:hypothetical protein